MVNIHPLAYSKSMDIDKNANIWFENPIHQKGFITIDGQFLVMEKRNKQGENVNAPELGGGLISNIILPINKRRAL